MARIVDPEKMNNIKKAAMTALAEHSYEAITIASISEKAGVSPGYLYRHYKSKEELMQELVELEMDTIVNDFIADADSSGSLYEVAYKTIKNLFMKANEEPMLARFTSSIVINMKMAATERADRFEEILESIGKCIKLGMKTGEVNPKITPTEVLIVAFTIPFRYLLVSLELDNYKKFTEEDVKRITEICMNAFK